MTVWQLERARLLRTRRALALAATFVLLGLVTPVITYYLPDLIKNAGNDDGVQIIVRKQTAIDGISSFTGNVDSLATLIVIVVAAATLCVDAHPILAAFYRTRLKAPALLLPRYATITTATLLALTAGTLAAWYETAVLLGSLSTSRLLAGLALEALWFCFAIAVVAAYATVIRGVAGTIGAAVATLLALGLPPLRTWQPNRLADGLTLALKHEPHLERPVIIAAVATVVLLALAVRLVKRREC